MDWKDSKEVITLCTAERTSSLSFVAEEDCSSAIFDILNDGCVRSAVVFYRGKDKRDRVTDR